MSSDSGSHFDLVPMTGPTAHTDRPEMVGFSLQSKLPLPDVSELPDVTLTDAAEEGPGEDIVPETVGTNPNVPMRIGSIWLDGESLMCSNFCVSRKRLCVVWVSSTFSQLQIQFQHVTSCVSGL